MLVIACQSSQTSTPPRVDLVEAPVTGDVASYVAAELARGTRENVPVLVYVGATWCEPCHALQDAVTNRSLDATLAPLRLLVFDLDRDRDRLEAAGYRSDLVPLFARPNTDGRASGRQTDGVRKGGGYVEQLVPRIKALVAAAP
jgi:thiol-disulfide isomerase/thioredoxin